jgi:transposase
VGVDGRCVVLWLGGGAALAFIRSAHSTGTLIQALEQLRRFLGGHKATLVWDGLPAHRSKLMWSWLHRQWSWLVVERLPAYTPELNPVEPLWSNLKATAACPYGESAAMADQRRQVRFGAWMSGKRSLIQHRPARSRGRRFGAVLPRRGLSAEGFGLEPLDGWEGSSVQV